MGHYAGYSEKDYKELLNALAKGKSKFLLSSYPSLILNQYIKKYKWKVKKIEKYVAVTKHTEKVKTEMLVFNYDPAKIKTLDKYPSIKQIESKLKQLKFAA
jgi:DNA adenine methylase